MMSDDSNNQSLATRATDYSVVLVTIDPIENAIVLWAEASTRTETRERDKRLRDKQQIIRSFLQFVGKHPGEVDLMDVRAWRKYLELKRSGPAYYFAPSPYSRFAVRKIGSSASASFHNARKSS